MQEPEKAKLLRRGTVTSRMSPKQASGNPRDGSRQLARRAIGSTLLLKGLEAEVAVIPASESIDPCISAWPLHEVRLG